MYSKILFILGLTALLSACSTQEQSRSAPLDLQTVQAYNNKVYSGNTVPANQRKPTQTAVDIPLNQSDYQPKVTVTQPVQPRIILAPSIGYHHGYYGSYWYY